MSWEGRIDVEVLASQNNWEMGFVLRHTSKVALTPQMVMDAVAEVLGDIFGPIPKPPLEELDG